MTKVSGSSIDSPDNIPFPDSIYTLAKEFARRSKDLKRDAGRLLWKIFALLIIGLFIVIFLPVGLNFLDQFAISGSAKEWLQTRESELLKEESKFEQIQKEIVNLIESINHDIKAPLSLWKLITTDFQASNLSTVLLKGDAVLAVGSTKGGTLIILRGTDDGEIWQSIKTNYDHNLSKFLLLEIIQLKNDTVLVIGKDADARVVIFQSTDNGRTWQFIKTDTTFDTLQTSAINVEQLESGTLLVSTVNKDNEVVLLRSTDDGRTWEPALLNAVYVMPRFSFPRLSELKSGVLLYSSVNNNQKGTILRSTDDGKTWQAVTPSAAHDVASNSFLHIKQLESGTLLLSIVKSDNEVVFLRSADDGKTWQSVADTVTNFSGFQQLKTKTVLVFGKNKNDKIIALRSVDDGRTWQSIKTNITTDISTLKELESGTVLASGSNNNNKIDIFRSTNDGKTWQSVVTNITAGMLTLNQLKSGIVLAEGGSFRLNKFILRSADDGKSWQYVTPHSLQNTGKFPSLNIEKLESGTVVAVSVNMSGKVIISRSDTVVNFLDRKSDLEKIKIFISQNIGIPFMKNYEVKVAKLMERKVRNNKARDDLHNGIQEFKNVAQQNVQGDAWAKQLYLQGTRVLVIALLIYLVQIYVNRFLYYIRLAGYYLARSDALIILNIEEEWKGAEEFKTLVTALSPESVEFGKMTAPSPQQIVQVASDLYKKK